MSHASDQNCFTRYIFQKVRGHRLRPVAWFERLGGIFAPKARTAMGGLGAQPPEKFVRATPIFLSETPIFSQKSSSLHRKFWKTVKPVFSNEIQTTSSVTLIED